MALLFSKVTMRDDYNEAEFFVSGFPQEPDDLEGWTAYHEFLDEITEDTLSYRTERRSTSTQAPFKRSSLTRNTAEMRSCRKQ